MHVSLSLSCLAFDALSGACMLVSAQIIGTFSAFLWTDSVSGTVLVLGSTMQRDHSIGVCLCAGFLLYYFRSVGSLEGLNTPTAEDEEGNEDERSSVLSEGIVHGNILAYLSGTSSPSRQTQWTPEK